MNAVRHKRYNIKHRYLYSYVTGNISSRHLTTQSWKYVRGTCDYNLTEKLKN